MGGRTFDDQNMKGGGVHKTPKLDDIISEQPIMIIIDSCDGHVRFRDFLVIKFHDCNEVHGVLLGS